MQYLAFAAEDFCKDPYFVSWVATPTQESDRFWQAFLRSNPHKAVAIETAKEYINMIQFQEMDPSEQDLARLKQRIWTDIDRRERPFRTTLHWYRHPRWSDPRWAAAAVVLLVSALAVGWWAYQASTSLTYETAYGKIQEIRLADGSVVTLNANSSLNVAADLGNNPVREVWLAGEAYFDIAKRRGAKFIVHTPEAQVEVLGTEFNVNTRRQQTNVVLHEGKVQLSASNTSAVVMKPGDMATVTPKARHIRLKRVMPDQVDAWKESYIVLDGKSLSEIVDSLEDTFGVTINIADSTLTNRKLTGKLHTEAADVCIENLAIIIEADVQKIGDTYLFK